MKREDNSWQAGSSRATGASGDGWWIKKALSGIESENIIRTGSGYKVRLDTDWVRMLGGLPLLGESLVITGNASAVLGCTRLYPLLEHCGEHLRASSADGSFDFEFIPWGAAFAVIQECHGLVSHHVEFLDYAGTVIHRLCLTEGARWDLLVEWVQCHQARESKPRQSAPFPPHRWRTVQQRHWFDYDEVIPVEAEALSLLLQAALEEEHPINVVVGNEGAVQSAEFIPRRIHPCKKWTFTSDDTAGLHFNETAIGDVIIHEAPYPFQRGTLSSLKCFDENGALLLAVTAPSDITNEYWNDFLHRSVNAA